MIILGLDPGTATTGYGVIKKENGDCLPISFGTIETSKELDAGERLNIIEKELEKIIEKNRPEAAAIEKLFFNRNVTTAMKVSEARGVLINTLTRAGIPIYEYTPLQIKQAVTGYGTSPKKDVQRMVKLLLKLKETPYPDDAADGLAAAICCGHSLRIETISKT